MGRRVSNLAASARHDTSLLGFQVLRAAASSRTTLILPSSVQALAFFVQSKSLTDSIFSLSSRSIESTNITHNSLSPRHLPPAYNMQSSFTHPLLFTTCNHDKRKQAKLFSGINTARDIHWHLNPKKKPRRPKSFAVSSFTLPYRSITMNHSNDKLTNTKSEKKSKINKKKAAQSHQPTQHINLAQPLHLSVTLPSRTMTEPQRNEPAISERRGIRWVCYISSSRNTSAYNSS